MLEEIRETKEQFKIKERNVNGIVKLDQGGEEYYEGGMFQPFIVKSFEKNFSGSFFNSKEVSKESNAAANGKRFLCINADYVSQNSESLKGYATAMQFNLTLSNQERQELDLATAEASIEKDFIEKEFYFK